MLTPFSGISTVNTSHFTTDCNQMVLLEQNKKNRTDVYNVEFCSLNIWAREMNVNCVDTSVQNYKLNLLN